MSDLASVARRVVGAVLLVRTPGNILDWGCFRVVEAGLTPSGALHLVVSSEEPSWGQRFENRPVSRGIYGSSWMFRNPGNPPQLLGNQIKLEDKLTLAGYDPAPMVFLV